MNGEAVPRKLRNWFVIHFVVDMLFAIPLMLAPVATLRLFDWQVIDPFLTRLVAAALFGIGIESFLGRNAGREAYMGMLNLKIIWSSAAIVGMAWSLIDGFRGAILLPSTILIVFLLFNGVWVYWRTRLSRKLDSQSSHR